jgi:phosphoglycerate kinase
MTKKRSLADLADDAIGGKRVLVRVDFNVPIEEGRVTDATRIEATLPTLRYLKERGARTILVSHLGRPKGKRDPSMTLEPAAMKLEELFGTSIAFVDDVAGDAAATAIEALEPGSVLVLQNVRFEAGEERNDEALGKRLAGYADVYVNDAFGTAHRAHSSTAAAPQAMRAAGRPAVAGFLIGRELEFLGGALDAPKRPFVAILGGAKISGKIDVIEALLPRVDQLLIGGAMANTFFRALDLETGESLIEPDRVEMAGELLRRAEMKLLLPIDCVVARKAEAGADRKIVARSAVPADTRILDIGPATVAAFAERIEAAGTVLWNGPMGIFEIDDFADGTRGIAEACARATKAGAITIAGGGDTAAALEAAGLADAVTHVSTGGGASLEFLEGRELPGIAILDDA